MASPILSFPNSHPTALESLPPGRRPEQMARTAARRDTGKAALVLPVFRGRGSMLLPVAVLLVGWTLSAWIFKTLQRDGRQRDEEIFDRRVAAAEAAIQVRMTGYVDALLGGASFFAASKSVERADWHVYAESLQLAKRYPGINGIGVIFPMGPDEVPAWLARMRLDGAPEPEIKPFPATTGPADDVKYVITFIEPVERNRVSVGRDIATEPSRRKAAELARDTGEPRMNRRIPGSRDAQRRSGFLLYVPLYRKGAPVETVAERRAAHVGWVYAQFFADNFLDGVLGPMGEALQLHFFEDGDLSREHLLYASQSGGVLPGTDETQDAATAAADALPRFERVTAMEMAGQRFRLGWQRGPKYLGVERLPAAWVAVSFTLATLLLAGLVVSLQTTGRRARALAEERTRELSAAQGRLQGVLDGTAYSVIATTSEGIIEVFNVGAERMLGYTAAEMVGRQTPAVVHLAGEVQTRAAELSAQLGRSIEPGFEALAALTRLNKTDEREWTYVRKDGSQLPVLLSFTALRDSGGAIIGFLGIAQDITERKRLEESLARARDLALQASRLKSEFLATVSHEIRTPMNAVIGMAELLAATPLNREQDEMARTIVGGAETLLIIINDILDFSRIEAGRIRLDPVDFDFRQVVEETMALLAPRAHEKGVELTGEFESAPESMLRGDSGRVRQVLTNLIGNAIKFTDAGEIAVKVRTVSETANRTRLHVSVRDTGIGVPHEAQPRLFQPFTQADGSTTRRFGGTGLGLAISRQLVELMGGEIGFESEPGKGSLFWMELELARAGTAAQEPGAEIPAGRRVLVVDDNETSRRILIDQLGRWEMPVEAAPDGMAALARLRDPAKGPWHLVLVDGEMPAMSGLELAGKIRADPALVELPLVLLSSTGQQPDLGTARAAGFADFLTKPVTAKQLRRCLSRVLTASPATAPVVSQAVGPLAARSGSRLRLLLVEDNPANQRVAAMLLAKMGFAVEVAANGQLALEQLGAQEFDAVLMDCQMPVLDGFETTRRIRAGTLPGVNARLPIIALTAYAQPEDRTLCLEAGMDDHVTKPIRSAELLAALERCGLRQSAAAFSAATVEPAASPLAECVIDPEALEAARALPGTEGPSLLPELVRLYLSDEAERLARLAQLAAERQAGPLQHEAHCLGGNAASFGGTQVTRVALDLEQLVRAGDWPEVPVQMVRLREACERLRIEVARLNLTAR